MDPTRGLFLIRLLHFPAPRDFSLLNSVRCFLLHGIVFTLILCH